eukprot:7045188-Prymnesium_polylepis.1
MGSLYLSGVRVSASTAARGAVLFVKVGSAVSVTQFTVDHDCSSSSAAIFQLPPDCTGEACVLFLRGLRINASASCELFRGASAAVLKPLTCCDGGGSDCTSLATFVDPVVGSASPI